jgi:hypothetical protein
VSAFDFIRWCFSSFWHGVGTLVVIAFVGHIAVQIIAALAFLAGATGPRQ